MLSAVIYAVAIVLAFVVLIACTYGIVRIERHQRQAFFERYGRWPTNEDYLDGDAFR